MNSFIFQVSECLCEHEELFVNIFGSKRMVAKQQMNKKNVVKQTEYILIVAGQMKIDYVNKKCIKIINNFVCF